MKCAECQNEMPQGSVFCPICGREAKEEPALATGETPPAKKKKKWWILAMAAGLLTVVVALVLFAGSRSGFVAYRTADGNYLIDLSGGEPVLLWKDGFWAGLTMTENQEHVFYEVWKENQPTKLYHVDLRSRSKEPEVLAENVDQFYVNAQGTRMAYIRDNNLYVYNFRSEKLIAESVGKFLCDEDIDTFVYSSSKVEGYDFAKESAWWFKDGNREAKLIGNGRKGVKMLRFSADGKTLIYSVDDKFYVWKNNEETLIAENATLATGVYEDLAFYYKTVNETNKTVHYFYDGKRSIKITDAQNVQAGMGKQPILWWQDEQSGHCYVATRDRVLGIPLEKVSEITFSEDGTRICMRVRDENEKFRLYMASVSGNKLEQMQLLMQDVRYIETRFVGKDLYYWDGEQEKTRDLYCNGREVLQDVDSFLEIHEETGAVLACRGMSSGDQGTVYMLRNGKVIKLTDEGGYPAFAPNGYVLVRKRQSGQADGLWCYDQNGKGRLVAEDAKGAIPIQKIRRPSTQIDWTFEYS